MPLLRAAAGPGGPRLPADELSPPERPDPPDPLGDDGSADLDEALVRRVLELGEIEVVGRMPWSSNQTFLVAVTHEKLCLRAVYKPRRGERPLWDFPGGLDRREAAAHELSSALGWHVVPVTVRRHDAPMGIGSLQRFVPSDFEQHYFTLVEDPARHAALKAICCLDLIGNNTDRKSGHCLAGADGRVHAIDNGLMFHEECKLRTVIWDFAGEPVPAGLLDAIGALGDGPLPEALAELLEPSEREALRRRAAELAVSATFPIDRTGRRYPWPLV